MRINEVIDEEERLSRWFATNENSYGMVWTIHKLSYYELRKMYKEQGEIMGLDDDMQIEYQYVRQQERGT